MAHTHILMRLFRGYGLGDAVQMSAVLRHLRKHRPNWIIDYCADHGRHSPAIGLVRNAFHYGEPVPSSHYAAEITITLYDVFTDWPDRPNTRVTSCLNERFGLAWDRDCTRYHVGISPTQIEDACDYLQTTQSERDLGKFQCVCLHYQGDSAPQRKNLTHEQAASICKLIRQHGRLPLILDWRNTSPLVDGVKTFGPGKLGCADQWGRDAAMNAAIISQCEAYIGIDSGPGKCATATDTPTLIAWTHHHPSLYHDPSPNTTHLVPVSHGMIPPVNGATNTIDFFEANYNFMTYRDDPVERVDEWLAANLA